MTTTRRTALRGAVALAAFTAAAAVPTIADAEYPDPTLVAAAKLKTAFAEYSAVGDTCKTIADEHTPEFRAVSLRLSEANDAFAEAPVTSPAGALAKLSELAEALEAYGYDGHIETLTAFLERLAGRAAA